MHEQITAYYRGERVSSFVFIGYGIFSIVASYAYYKVTGTKIAEGLAYSIGLIGLGIIIIGMARFWKTIRFYKSAISDVNLSYLKSTEYIRLEQKELKFQHIRIIMTTGILMSFIGLIASTAFSFNDFFVGTVIGLALNCGYILAFDLFAQFRMKEYMHHLHKIL